MTTIAELGLAVNSESAVQAADNLEGMVEAGARAEQAINKVAETSEQAKARLLALGKAAMESSTYQEALNRAYEAMTITPRGRRKSIDFQVVLPADQISSVQRTLDDVDDMPSLYVGSSELEYTVIVGIFDDFDTGLPTYNRGEYTLKVRSLN